MSVGTSKMLAQALGIMYQPLRYPAGNIWVYLKSSVNYKMEKLYIENLELNEREFIFERIPCITIGLRKINAFYYSSFSYGEFFLYEKSYPKYYYTCFSPDGSLKKIAEYAFQNDIEIEKLLISILKRKGYRNVKRKESNNTLVEIFKLRKTITLQLLEIIEI